MCGICRQVPEALCGKDVPEVKLLQLSDQRPFRSLLGEETGVATEVSKAGLDLPMHFDYDALPGRQR